MSIVSTVLTAACLFLLLLCTGEAMGLSFSVPPGVRVPPSLQNMYKELASDLGCKVPNHGCLEKVGQHTYHAPGFAARLRLLTPQQAAVFDVLWHVSACTQLARSGCA